MSRVTAGTVDVHAHSVPRGWPDLATACGGGVDWPSLRIESEREAVIMLGDKEFRRITDASWNADVRLAAMVEDRIHQQVVSPTPVFFCCDRPGEQAAKVATIFNDLALDLCAQAPGRLLPFCQVPLQDPDAACRELDRSLANGHVGVEIGNHLGERDLDDEGIVTFLQHCAEVDAPVFVHPWDMPTSPRLDRWMARWLVGMPGETHLSITAMILGGVFDRLPRSLRICFAHGGGSLPYALGRMDNAWRQRPDAVGTSKEPPSHYTQRFYVDSVVFDDRTLRFLVDRVGPDRVVVGSDYPYPLGERPAGRVVRDNPLLTDAERTAILSTNAGAFLGERARATVGP
ncbi:MAG: amidohydrolase family protein [Candidatus Nanopelagicales bacterium]